MKRLRSFSAALLACCFIPITVLAQLPSGSNPTNNNPTPADCCTCIIIEIDGKEANAKPGEESSGYVQEEDGSYKVEITVTLKDSDSCTASEDPPAVTSVKVKSVSPEGGEVVLGVAGGAAIITPEMVRQYKYDWKVVVECDGKADTSLDGGGGSSGSVSESETGCTKNFKLSPCAGGCSSGSSCESTGDPGSENGSFTVTIPTTAARGGLSGSLRFHAADFSFPGRAGLYPLVPSNFIVARDGGGLLTSIDTGEASLEITDVSGQDAFTVIHKDSGGTPFRTTTISFVEEGAVPKFRMDTAFQGVVTRHEQTMPDEDTQILEKGSVISVSFHPIRREIHAVDSSTPGIRIHSDAVEERASSSGTWQRVSDVEITWESQSGGWVKTKETIDPAGAALTSTWSYYQPGEITGPGGSTEGLGRLKHHVRHDG